MLLLLFHRSLHRSTFQLQPWPKVLKNDKITGVLTGALIATDSRYWPASRRLPSTIRLMLPKLNLKFHQETKLELLTDDQLLNKNVPDIAFLMHGGWCPYWFWVHQWISLTKYIQCDVLLSSLSSKLNKLELASIKNTSWLWRTFLTPGMEMGNPKWIQCDVPDHTFHVENDWGWFLHSVLKYGLTISTGAKVDLDKNVPDIAFLVHGGWSP